MALPVKSTPSPDQVEFATWLERGGDPIDASGNLPVDGVDSSGRQRRRAWSAAPCRRRASGV